MQHKSLQWLQQHFSSDELWLENRICYFVIAIVNTTDFLCASNAKPYDILEGQISTL